MSENASFERFDRGGEMEPLSARVFGFAFAVLFVSIGCAPALHGGVMRRWAVAIAVALALVAVFRPAILAPLAAAWSRILRPVQSAVTIAVMGLLFFLVITPAGLLRRMLVRDPLRLRFEPGAPSYWQQRQTTTPESMVNQF